MCGYFKISKNLYFKKNRELRAYLLLFFEFYTDSGYILTIAHILLTDNDTNINDQDQVEIMKEVVNYFEHPKSGVCGFTEMKNGWKNTSIKVTKGVKLEKEDLDVIEAVESWLQEEKDMALQLSKKLGLMVLTGNNKFKNNYTASPLCQYRCRLLRRQIYEI